jgi:hypothetical protein
VDFNCDYISLIASRASTSLPKARFYSAVICVLILIALSFDCASMSASLMAI